MPPSNIIPFRGQQMDESLMTEGGQECPICRFAFSDTDHGWTKTYGVHTCTPDHLSRFGYCLVPCPFCSGDVQEKNQARRKTSELARLFGGANIPFPARDWTFATFPVKDNQHMFTYVQEWVRDMLAGDEDRKRGLFLNGELGVGKTSLAISALKEALHAGIPGLFITTSNMLMHIRASYGKNAPFRENEVLRALTETPYVVIDDLGAEEVSDHAIKQLYYLFNERLNQGLYTLITSNRTAREGPKSLRTYWSQFDPLNAERAIERLLQHCEGVTVQGNLRKRGGAR